MLRTEAQRQKDQERQATQSERWRLEALDGLEAELRALNARRARAEELLQRVREPVELEELKRLAGEGRELTQYEIGRLAIEDPATFNRLADEGVLA